MSANRSRVVLVALTLWGVPTLFSGLAWASDHRIPKADLLSGSDRQHGYRLAASWAKRVSEEFCDAIFVDRPPDFPEWIRYERGSFVVVRLRKVQPPTEVFAEAWSRVGRDGNPRGPSEESPWLLLPQLQDGNVAAWDILLRPAPESRHYYLEVDATWPDDEGCGTDQHAIWRFHLRASGDAVVSSEPFPDGWP